MAACAAARGLRIAVGWMTGFVVATLAGLIGAFFTVQIPKFAAGARVGQVDQNESSMMRRLNVAALPLTSEPSGSK